MPRISQPDYTYDFEGITDRLSDSRLRITDHGNDLTHTISVAVDDTEFLDIRGRQLRSGIADLIDFAVSIHEADRWSKRPKDAPCRIQVRLPVRHPEVLSATETQELLERFLYWYTGDAWAFEFGAFDKQRRFAERQLPLWAAPQHEIPVEVALWSGGLDSLAGLCNRVAQNSAERYLLFGAGGNFSILSTQRRVADAVKQRLSWRDISLTQLTIHQRETKRLRWDGRLRARSLVFMLLGAAFTLLEGQHSLMIYENGYGALNLPFRASEVGLDHVRAVHPLSLLYLSEFVSQVVGEAFTFNNPFLFQTKAQMCHVLEELDVVDIAWMTTSCDRRHRKQTKECGRCSSCLLRRQAFAVVGFNDQTEYLVQKETGRPLHHLLKTSHLPAMQFQVNRLRHQLGQPDAWDILARQHPSLLADLVTRISNADSSAPEELKDQIIGLLQTYTDEWTASDVSDIFDAEMDAIQKVPKRVEAARVALG